MLHIFRQKNVQKVVLWAILILILPAFVIWGAGSLGRSREKGPTSVGTINGKKISFDEFGGNITSVRCQIIMNYFAQPKVMEAFLKSRSFVAKLAWDRLLILKEAKLRKMNVSDADLVAYVRNHPIFARNGQFDPRIYEYVLKHSMGLDPRSFEEMTRESLEIQRLNDLLTKDIAVTDDEVLEGYRKDNAKFKIFYVMVPSDDFTGKVKIEDAQVKEYYDKHKDEFIVPIKPGETAGVPKGVSYDDMKADIRSFLAAKEAGTLALAAAEEQRRKLTELMASEKLTFEQAAEKLGMKLGTTQSFSRSDYLEGVGEAAPIAAEAAKLKKGEVSSPVDTRKGAMIFRVSEVQDIDMEKFSKEKADYTKKVLDEKKALRLEGWLRELEAANTLNIDLNEIEKYYR